MFNLCLFIALLVAFVCIPALCGVYFIWEENQRIKNLPKGNPFEDLETEISNFDKALDERM